MAQIKTTTLDFESDNLISDFVNIYNTIFPLKLESEYITLGYLVNSYIVLCNKITKVDMLSKKSTSGNTKIYPELESIAQDLDEMLPRIKEMSGSISQESTSDEISDLYGLVSRLSVLTRRKENLREQVSSNNEAYYKQESDISLLRTQLSDIVLQIKEQLKSISMLNINDQRRIDTLEVKPHHLAIIDKWSILDTDKEALKDRLKGYLDFRVVLFKCIEDFAYELVPAYGKRQIYNGEYNNVIPAFFALAGLDITQDLIGPFFSTRYADEQEMYQFINGYYKTGVCDVEAGRRLMNYSFSWALKESINDILNHVNKEEVKIANGPKK